MVDLRRFLQRLMDWGQIRTVFEKAVERAGLLYFRFHDLRHTAASHLAMRGRTLKEI